MFEPSARRRAVVFATVLAGLAIGCGPQDEFRMIGGDGIVRGTILNGLDPSEPEGQVRVSLEGVRGASEATRQSGEYEIRDVDPGLYDLVAVKTIAGVERRARVRFIEVVADQLIDMPDVELALPGSISGTVTLEGAGPGNPVAPDNSGIVVTVVGTGLSAVTDAAGAFSISPVEIGQYQLRAGRDDFEARVVSDVDVVAEFETTVTFDPPLRRKDPPTSGTLGGRVLLEAGDPNDFSGITVTLEGTTRQLVTTPGGFWAFDDLPVGPYQALFTHPDYFDQRQTGLQVLPGFPVNTAPDVTLLTHAVLSDTLEVTGLAEAPSGNQLAFLTANGDASEIGLLAPDGTAFTQTITAGAAAAADRGIAWAPDESEIFFVQFVGGPVNAYRPALIPNAGGTPRALLADGTDYFLGDFSPRGPGNLHELGFYLTGDLQAVLMDDDPAGQTQLVTSTQRVLAAGVGTLTELGGFEWANTARVALSRESMALPSEVFTVLANGNFAPTALTPRRQDPPADTGAPLVGRFQSPTFSPDFTRLAFSVEAGGGGDPAGIYIADVDGENAIQVSTEPGRYLDWSRDGTRIYYAREADRRPAVLLVPRVLR